MLVTGKENHKVSFNLIWCPMQTLLILAALQFQMPENGKNASNN